VVRITPAIAAESIQRRVLQMDESLYYDMLSAFCKSLRGSDSTAALAWFAKLIHAGMDPRIIARRIIAHASEDVGLANPTVLNQCVAAAQALELIGMPEARLPLAQAIILLCESPKSNGVVMAVEAAMADAEHTRSEPVPLHLQDAHYKGAERLGCGKDYLYPHDFPGHYVAQNYRPAGLENREYFLPGTEGYELKIREIRARRGQPIGGEQP
jgi:putative ATPase